MLISSHNSHEHYWLVITNQSLSKGACSSASFFSFSPIVFLRLLLVLRLRLFLFFHRAITIFTPPARCFQWSQLQINLSWPFSANLGTISPPCVCDFYNTCVGSCFHGCRVDVGLLFYSDRAIIEFWSISFSWAKIAITTSNQCATSCIQSGNPARKMQQLQLGNAKKMQ